MSTGVHLGRSPHGMYLCERYRTLQLKLQPSLIHLRVPHATVALCPVPCSPPQETDSSQAPSVIGSELPYGRSASCATSTLASELAAPSRLMERLGEAARGIDFVADRRIEADHHVQQCPHSGCDACPAE